MPSCLTIERCTSATVTFSMTWSRPRTVDRVDDLVGAAGEPGGEFAGLLGFDLA